MSRGSCSRAYEFVDEWEPGPASGVRRCVAGAKIPHPDDAHADIQRVFEDTPGLSQVVEEAEAQLRERFGRNVMMELEYFEDPESTIHAPVLFLAIRTNLDPRQADEILEKFDEEWWIDNMPRARQKLEFILKPL